MALVRYRVLVRMRGGFSRWCESTPIVRALADAEVAELRATGHKAEIVEPKKSAARARNFRVR